MKVKNKLILLAMKYLLITHDYQIKHEDGKWKRGFFKKESFPVSDILWIAFFVLLIFINW